MTDYRNVSRGPVPLASGQVLAPGETGPADIRDPHDKGLRDDGLIVLDSSQEGESETAKTTKKKEG